MPAPQQLTAPDAAVAQHQCPARFPPHAICAVRESGVGNVPQYSFSKFTRRLAYGWRPYTGDGWMREVAPGCSRCLWAATSRCRTRYSRWMCNQPAWVGRWCRTSRPGPSNQASRPKPATAKSVAGVTVGRGGCGTLAGVVGKAASRQEGGESGGAPGSCNRPRRRWRRR